MFERYFINKDLRVLYFNGLCTEFFNRLRCSLVYSCGLENLNLGDLLRLFPYTVMIRPK